LAPRSQAGLSPTPRQVVGHPGAATVKQEIVAHAFRRTRVGGPLHLDAADLAVVRKDRADEHRLAALMQRRGQLGI
jgi:hypothetical protein